MSAQAGTRPGRIQKFGYLAFGIVLAVCAVAVGGVSWTLLVFVLAPDLPLVFGGGVDLRPGQLNPKAVKFYNATHRLTGPVLLALAALVAASRGNYSGQELLPAAAAWAAHICLDRGLGYGLRTPEGFQR